MHIIVENADDENGKHERNDRLTLLSDFAFEEFIVKWWRCREGMDLILKDRVTIDADEIVDIRSSLPPLVEWFVVQHKRCAARHRVALADIEGVFLPSEGRHVIRSRKPGACYSMEGGQRSRITASWSAHSADTASFPEMLESTIPAVTSFESIPINCGG